jgi:hypothetical protein
MKYDLTGKKFGRLTVIKKCDSKGRKVMWECVCDCGKLTSTTTSHLTSGHTQSCGCLQREKTGNASRKHGATGTDLYNVWRGMRQRCYDKLATGYYKYGARGITICEEWLTFENFRKDMEEGYKKGLSIDRIDNSFMYCKDNCKWSTPTEQCNNRRSSKIITYQGVTDTLANLARTFNVPYAKVQRRLVDGWSVEDAFNKPTQTNQFG